MANYDKLRGYRIQTINPNTMSANYNLPNGGFFRSRHTGDIEVICLDDSEFVFTGMSDGLLMDWMTIKSIKAGSASTSVEVIHLAV